MKPAVALCIAAFLAGAGGAEAQTPSAQSQGGRYLVVPFENTSREPRVYWLSEGSAVLLTDDLWRRLFSGSPDAPSNGCGCPPWLRSVTPPSFASARWSAPRRSSSARSS